MNQLPDIRTGEDADVLRERQNAVLGSGGQVWHVISVLAELGIADLLADGPVPITELAAATETDASALRRVLRCAAAVGIFTELEDSRFALSPLAEGLVSTRVGGLRPMVRFHNMDFVRKSYARILHSVRTGEPAFDQVFGMPFHEYLEHDEELARFYAGFLTHFSKRLADRFVGRLGLDRFDRIADLGAGTGHFLARMLVDRPPARGWLFDQPNALDTAVKVLAEHGVAERVTVVAGDLFTGELPAGCDLYTLKSVLHRLSDERAVTVLRRIREAMDGPGGTVIVIDQIVPPLDEWDHAKAIDIDTLVLYGGKERTLAEWTELFDEAGFVLQGKPEARGWAHLEIKPVG
jgi:hypothetical protein